MAQIIWSGTALQDLKSIGNFIEQGSEYYAKIFIQRLYNSVKRLELFPESGRKSIDFRSLNLREVIYQSYKVIYSFEDETVKILTIVHCKRDV
ncbi:MAG: type II toxin-antitoxin system RelE/ParE family toxin [Candidatus Kapabacteria bacterium]|nr:type II toxin-antitoxin system RelE/ParE family toxin [Candidatus Kapabacteria bacterium]